MEVSCVPAPSIGEKCAPSVPLPENTKCVGGAVIEKEWYCPHISPWFNWILGAFIFSVIGILFDLGGLTVGGKGSYWLTVSGAFILSGAALFASLVGC